MMYRAMGRSIAGKSSVARTRRNRVAGACQSGAVGCMYAAIEIAALFGNTFVTDSDLLIGSTRIENSNIKTVAIDHEHVVQDVLAF